MESDIIIEAVAIIVLIVFSAFFSATETAFTSLNRIRLKIMAGDGNKKAARVLELSEKYDKLLTTILIGNNVVNIAMTAIATVLFIKLCGAYGATVSTIVITVFVLIFGEITPKNVAKEKPESFAMFASPVIGMLMTVLTPVNYVFTQWKKLVIRIFKISSGSAITDDEILTLVEEAEQEGGIDERQSRLIQNAIEFDETTAEEVMTPRTEMAAVEKDCTVQELSAVFRRTGFSRLPVYEEDIDNIVGVINQKDFNYYVVEDGKEIADIVKPVVFVNTSLSISNLLVKMQQLKSHMAVVINEYGGTEGLVTMEDVIEELVGEIYDEHDAVMSQDVIRLQNGSYRIKGSANISKVFDFFDIDEEMGVNTVNGWVMMQLDRLPAKGDAFEQVIDGQRLSVRVTKADGRKAKEVNVIVCDADEDEQKQGENK